MDSLESVSISNGLFRTIMKRIALKNGGSTMVDDDDFEELSKFQWLKTFHGYVVRYVGRTTIVRMHRVVTGVPVGDERCVDHINGDKLDNRRCNLRVCSKAENNRNRRISRNNTSGYKGVSWHKDNQRWQAQIRAGGKVIPLGMFETAEAASDAYKAAATRLHGEFASFDR